MPTDWTGRWLTWLGTALQVEPQDNLDYSQISVQSVPAPWLADAAIGDATRFGIRLRLAITKEPWTCQIEADAVGVRVATGDGIEQAFDSTAEFRLRAAIDDDDVDAILRASEGAVVNGLVYFQNAPDRLGAHWMRSGVSFLRLLNSPARVAVAQRLISSAQRTLQLDYEPIEARCRGLAIGGPGHTTLVPPEVPGPSKLTPEPIDLASPIADALRQVVVETCWATLFRPNPAPPGVVPTIHLEGMRTVDIELMAHPTPEETQEAIDLLIWASVDDASDRREALVQAASVAVGAHGLHQASGAVLRTARSLLRLSRRLLIQEAFAARRSAHEEAMRATRAAGEGSTEAAYKARDRVLVEVAAGVAVAIANATKVISHPVAAGLYCVLIVAIGVVLAMALTIDFPAAKDGLSSFLSDLPFYSDALDPTDVQALTRLQSVTSARATITRAQSSVVILCVGVVVAVAIIAAFTLAA